MKKPIVSVVSLFVTGLMLCHDSMSLGAIAATSTEWSVNYHPQTSTNAVKVVYVNTYGPGYVAACTSINGNAPTIMTDVESYNSNYPTNKTIRFTRTDIPISFYTTPVYFDTQIPFEVSISVQPNTYWGSSFGTIRINT